MAENKQAKQQAEQAKEETKPWIRRLGRFGYMMQGLVYGLIGVLALMAAFGAGGETTGTSGVLQSLAAIPLGKLILWLVAVGLVGYVLWAVILGIKDPNKKGHDVKGIAVRIGYLISAIIYGSIAFQAVRLASSSGGGGGNSEQTISAKVMSYPLGQWVIGAVGIIIVGYGLYELISGISGSFMKNFKSGEMNRHEKRIARNSGRMGLISRGAVLGLVGVFFVLTAYHANPDEARGLDGALSELAQQPYGSFLLGIIAVGFILFGVYCVIRGRYERMSFGKYS